VRCRGCGLVYVWPQPSPEELAALYQAGGYHEAIDEAERRRYFARRLRQIEALACGTAAHGCAACGWGVPAPRPTAVGGCATRRVLDVGCSKGYFLEAARDAGWEAVGLDLNRRAVEEAKSRGLDARQGDLAQLVASGEWQGATFDVVTLFDVLEHMRDPRATLAACHEVLRPGGLLVLTTPDVGGLVPRVTYALFGRTLGAWEHPTPPGHLVQFARRTLRQALAAEGFEVVRERSEHIPLAYSVGKLENSIMDVLAGRSAERRIPDSESQIPDQQSGTSNQKSLIARFPRYVVRALSWFVIGLLGLAARATGWGDSLFVTARRAERRD
jgi:2-polyprenyl-3-methyl-5-hydroxy-6-metoxy-1,4-benzoquinol methylase